MAYRLTIADVVELPVKFTVNDAGKTSTHAFTLQAKRLDQAQLREVLQDSERLTRDLLQQQVTGWRGQRLVVEDDGNPAEFTPDAFGCLLGLVGMEAVVVAAYLRALTVADTQGERSKN